MADLYVSASRSACIAVFPLVVGDPCCDRLERRLESLHQIPNGDSVACVLGCNRRKAEVDRLPRRCVPALAQGIEGNRCAGTVLAVGDSCRSAGFHTNRRDTKDVHAMLGLQASARELR